MSLIDKLNVMSDDQAITADAISTNVIDILAVAGAVNASSTGGPGTNLIKDIGAGRPLYLHILVTTTFDGAADTSSLICTLESDDNTSLSTATVHMTLQEDEEATLVAGYWIAKGVPLPPGSYQRYVGIRYNVGAEENFTAGKVQAWISDKRHDTTQYKGGWTTGVN